MAKEKEEAARVAKEKEEEQRQLEEDEANQEKLLAEEEAAKKAEKVWALMKVLLNSNFVLFNVVLCVCG